MVASRSAGSYPFTRAILNDAGEFFCCSRRRGARSESGDWTASIATGRGPARDLRRNGVLSGDGFKNGEPVHVELRSTGPAGVKPRSRVAAARKSST